MFKKDAGKGNKTLDSNIQGKDDTGDTNNVCNEISCLSDPEIQKVLLYGSRINGLFVSAYIIVVVAFILEFVNLILNANSFVLSILVIIFIVLSYILSIGGIIVSTQLYKIMNLKNHPLGILLIVFGPLLMFLYFSQMMNNSREYLIQNCSDEKYNQLKIRKPPMVRAR